MNFTNILGTITAILTTVAAFLTALGCAPGASDFVATCQIDFLPAEWVAYIAIAAGGVFGALALVGKLTRPGPKLASLFGSTAVVVPETSPKSGPGTVTPEQVAAP
jgi:TRAP-type C4-dicarboxylate transport system permease small subunit